MRSGPLSESGISWHLQVVLSSAERYNPQKDTWRNITPMQKKRAGLALVAFDGYVCADLRVSAP